MEVIVFLGIAIIEGILSFLAKTKIKTVCNCAIVICSIIAAFYLFYNYKQISIDLEGANWFWILVQKSLTKEKIIKVIKGFVLAFSIAIVLVVMPCCAFDET